MNALDANSTDSAHDFTATIKTTARQLLATVGAGGLTPEAVARDSALSPAEVETLFPHRDDLLTALLIDAYDESATAMERADRAAVDSAADSGARLLAVARALRAWAVGHPAEFALLYGSPVPGYHAPMDTVPPAARTPAVLAGIIRAGLEAGELSPPRRAVPGPPLTRPEAVALFGTVPDEPHQDLIERGIVLWSGLIGLLAFEVFSRTHDSVRDQAAFFDFAVAVAAEGVGITVPAA